MSPSGWEQNAVYLQSGNPETEDTPTLMQGGLLGSRFTIMTGVSRAQGTLTTPAPRSKRYQLVKTDSTMSVAPFPGATAYWADKSTYLVTTVNTNLNAVAGVFNNNVTKGNYTCVQVTGPCYVKFVDADSTAAAVSDQVIGSATVGKANRLATGTAPTTIAFGRVSTPLTKLASEARVLVDLDVPETT